MDDRLRGTIATYLLLEEELFGDDILFFSKVLHVVAWHHEKYLLKNHSLVRHETRLENLDWLIQILVLTCVEQLRMD